MAGGHTIDDYPPKYGLSVTGVVHPNRIISNAHAGPGDVLILTKPIGAGVLIAAQRLNIASPADYRAALDNMKTLNRNGADIMQQFDVRCATDITGFSLIGHSLNIARESGVTLHIFAEEVPLLSGAYTHANDGCIPGAAFRNQEFCKDDCLVGPDIDYTRKMLLFDAQTSGGLLICVPQGKTSEMLPLLRESGYPHSAIIGVVTPKEKTAIIIE
jgi:selenide,water dikinase